MSAGPMNQLLKERAMNAANAMPPACPYTLVAGEESTVVGLNGEKKSVPVRFVPCIGSRCMAFATFPGPDGKAHPTCQRLIVGQMLDNMAGMLEAGVLLLKADLEARGVAIPVPPGENTNPHQ